MNQYHPFPIVARSSTAIPTFLERSRMTLDEIRKSPFKLTRTRSRLKPAKKEERIDSAKLVSLDISKCKVIHRHLKEICEELGWKIWTIPRQLGICDIYWHGHQVDASEYLCYKKGGTINKFPFMADIVKKINLTRALENLHMIFPDEYDFYPRTWFLPQQYHEFCADVAYDSKSRKRNKPAFIVKPDAGTQGEGIYLIMDPHDYMLTKNLTHAVQEYVSSPFLIDKMKFDLRIYAVLLSINPVSIYMSKEGLARFCTIPYKEPSSKNIQDSFMHLTNYSLNKNSERYVHTDRFTDGSKRTITSILIEIAKLGHDTNQVWTDIEKVVLKTMLAILPEIQIAHNLTIRSDNKVKCFHILGFDILLTDKLKPIVLEVNANPSLSMTYDKEVAPGVFEEVPSAVDKYVKFKMIKESLLLAAPREKVLQNLQIFEEPIVSEPMTGYECLFADECHPSSFLYEIFPANNKGMYDKLRILERLSSIFQASLGLHETLMSANSFRMFARRCCLVHQSPSLNVAALDILYIETQRRWMDIQADVPQGLTFHAFIETFIEIAKRSKLRSPNIHEMLDNLLHYCEANLYISSKTQMKKSKLPKIPVRYKIKQAEGYTCLQPQSRSFKLDE